MAFNNTRRRVSNSVAKPYQYKKQLIKSGLRVMLSMEAPSMEERLLVVGRIQQGMSQAGSLNQTISYRRVSLAVL
jgi:hypothetical protein